MALVKFVTIPFDDGTSSSLLLTFAEVSLGRIVAHNTGLLEGHFTDRIPLTRAAITAAANALNASMADAGSKLATQKMQIEIKKAFRASLPNEILVVYSGLVAAVGAT